MNDDIHRWPDRLPCTLHLDSGVPIDLDAAEEPRQLRLRGAPGYAEVDWTADEDPDEPEDEMAPPATFDIETDFGPLRFELHTRTDGLVILASTTCFENATDEAFSAALRAFGEVYEIWELALLEEPSSLTASGQAAPSFMSEAI